ncbi:MAG: hypothetical protein EOO42_10365 [Flavobacteriales bacterium]|nr:MAG: hypothetical protein EOO42_10365 [Flavobacteriales bacterium]
MKKFIASPFKKFNYSLIFGLAMLLLFVNSCKKDEEVSEKIDPVQLAKIQDYAKGPKLSTINFSQFKKKANIQALGNLKDIFLAPAASKEKTMFVHTTETYEGFSIETDSINVITAKGRTSYVFPVKLSSARAITFQNLTIDEGPTGTLVFVNTYTPTKKWIADWKAGKAGKFEGDISVSYLNNGQLTLSNGTATSAKGKIASANTDSKVALVDANGCETTTYYFPLPYNCASGNHGPFDPNCVLTGNDRAGITMISFEVTRCNNDGNNGGGGGTTPTPPGDYDPCGGGPTAPTSVSYNGAKGAKLMVHENPGCNPQPPVVEDPTPPKDIRDKTQEPCISKTVQSALALNKDIEGKMSDIIKNFDASKSVKINVFDGQIFYKNSNGSFVLDNQGNKIPKPGETLPHGFTNGVFSADIFLGVDYHKDSSKESVVATLIHEIVHSYLAYSGDNSLNTAHHNIISEKYITPMAGYMHQMFGISLKDAYALAWSGVPDSKAWKEAASDFEFEMSDGNKITKAETSNLSGPYKLSTKDPENTGFTKGTKICD